MDTPQTMTPAFLDGLETATEKLSAIREAIQSVVYGQEEAVTNALVTILAGGHMLLVGVPGVAKTLLVSTIGKVLGLETKRVQCTPDIMPSDILGTEILEELDYGKRNFRFVQGPIFAQLLMVDEINRASPRTQAALLQAMQEKIVTVGGHEHALPLPFHVLATQNPLEQEGTYALPEAELDRFLMQVDIGYPDEATEKAIIGKTMLTEPTVRGAAYAANVRDMQQLIRTMPLPENLTNLILKLVRNARPETTELEAIKKYVAWGPGPRASQAFSLAIRARALLEGRLAPEKEDILALLKPILQHRLLLNFAARADNVGQTEILEALKTYAAAPPAGI